MRDSDIFREQIIWC